jgi:D-alanine-D-alanine ligase-like ATP-grasp enzyme
VNRTADSLGIPTPKEVSFLGETASPAIADLDKLHQVIESQISYPAFIKPIKGDNSLGITGRSIVRNKTDLTEYMAQLRSMGIVDVLVQEYLEGTEYGVGMVGNPSTGFHFFPILEIDYSKILEKSLPPILGFDSKWDPSSPYWTDIGYKRAVLSPEVEANLKKACITLWERFGCRDYARFDFRCDKGRGDGFDGLNGAIKLLEVNPNPGWCWDGKLAYMAKLEGIKYKDMIRMILASSWDRVQREEQQAVESENLPSASLDSDETTSR